MAEEKNNDDWMKNDHFFDGKLPRLDLSSINNYVQNALSRISIEGPAPFTEVFETHQNVIARVKVPGKFNPDRLRAYVNANHLKLEGLTGGGNEQIVNLPCCVEAASSKALVKNGILEIKMPKIKHNSYYYEVPIHFAEQRK